MQAEGFLLFSVKILVYYHLIGYSNEMVKGDGVFRDDHFHALQNVESNVAMTIMVCPTNRPTKVAHNHHIHYGTD